MLGPMLETLDYTIHIGSTPTILYFDLYLYSAYAAHYVYFNIFIVDFNINWLDGSNRRPLYNLFVICNNYRQLISTYTTDNQTTIDHVYTNLPESQDLHHLD